MFDFTRGRFSHQFSSFRRSWCRQQSLPFTDVLSAERVQSLLAEEGVRFRRNVFTPMVTLWMFLGQVLNPDHSCREAVAHLIAFLVGQGERPCAAGDRHRRTCQQRTSQALRKRQPKLRPGRGGSGRTDGQDLQSACSHDSSHAVRRGHRQKRDRQRDARISRHGATFVISTARKSNFRNATSRAGPPGHQTAARSPRSACKKPEPEVRIYDAM